MKNFIKLGFIMAVAMTTVGMRANTNDFSLRVMETNGKIVSFSINDTKQAHISLAAANGDVIFQEDATGNGTILRTYDFRELPKGKYTLTAETEASTSTHNIEVSNENATVGEGTITAVVKPMVVKKNNGRVSVSIINKQQTPIEISLYDADNVELYSTTEPASVSLIKMFDFNKVSQGTYTFVAKYGNRTFTEEVTIGK